MNAAIRDGEMEGVETCRGKRIELREFAAYALQQWPLTAIEEAVGRDAALVLPPALRTRKLTVRLPRYQIRALQVLADEGRESVEAMLTRMFEELADLHQERLARFIPGLAEAIAWPEAERTPENQHAASSEILPAVILSEGTSQATMMKRNDTDPTPVALQRVAGGKPKAQPPVMDVMKARPGRGARAPSGAPSGAQMMGR